MEDITFSSIKELYNRLLPALKSKRKLLVSDGYKGIPEKEIWEYMYLNKWKDETGITLADMVSDILHEDNKILNSYHQKKVLEEYSK